MTDLSALCWGLAVSIGLGQPEPNRWVLFDELARLCDGIHRGF